MSRRLIAAWTSVNAVRAQPANASGSKPRSICWMCPIPRSRSVASGGIATATAPPPDPPGASAYGASDPGGSGGLGRALAPPDHPHQEEDAAEDEPNLEESAAATEAPAEEQRAEEAAEREAGDSAHEAPEEPWPLGRGWLGDPARRSRRVGGRHRGRAGRRRVRARAAAAAAPRAGPDGPGIDQEPRDQRERDQGERDSGPHAVTSPFILAHTVPLASVRGSGAPCPSCSALPGPGGPRRRP